MASRAQHPKVRAGRSAVTVPRAPPAAGVVSEAVFGARLARALDALLAMQQADAVQLARGPAGPHGVLFTALTGTISFEEDCLVLHILCNCGMSMSALLGYHQGVLPRVAEPFMAWTSLESARCCGRASTACRLRRRRYHAQRAQPWPAEKNRSVS